MGHASFSLTFRLDAVVQLINAHTNEPILKRIPRIFINCPAKIARKENGLYTFSNVEYETFEIRIELPQFLPEVVTLTRKRDVKPCQIRCTPDPKFIVGNTETDTTYFDGTAEENELVFISCPVKYCKIKYVRLLDDGRALFESRNFLQAGTGRWIKLETESGKNLLVRTDTDTEYNPLRYFVTDKPLEQPEEIKNISPLFCSRADSAGKFIIPVFYADDGECEIYSADGKVIKKVNYKADSWVSLDT